jgi:hypothetical protein
MQQLTAGDGDITSGDPGLLIHSNYVTSLDGFLAQDVGSSPADWPNEPAGWTPIFPDYDFSDVLPDGDVPNFSGKGWGIVNDLSGGPGTGAARVSDASAPVSPPYVTQFNYPIGFHDGNGPGNLYYIMSPIPTKFYVGFWWKVSNPWEDEIGHVNKVMYIENLVDAGLTFQLYGPPPYSTRMVGFGTAFEDVSYPENAGSSSPFPLGVWHQVEILVNEPTGALLWWMDGVLLGNYTGTPRLTSHPGTSQPYPSNMMERLIMNPTWGGGPGPDKSQPDQMWFDHVHASSP